jgi:hypothetical protein
MSLYKTFKVDANAEENGVPIQYPANEDGTIPTFYVTRTARTNKRYLRAVETVMRPYRRELELEALPEKKAQELNLTIFVKGVLLGWQNVQDEAGNTLEFNEANAVKLLSDLPELYADLQTQSTRLSNFKAKETEADAKNL